jgi:two-component system phosphate regulon sensor histidine kinase PhoR
MDQGVVASLPLGLVVMAAIALLALGAVSGWLAARARTRRRSRRAARESLARMADLLNALPQAALVTDADTRIVARNSRAAQLLRAFGKGDDLPLVVDAAIGRVIRSRIAETLELPSPANPARRLQASVAPLDAAEALVLFADPNGGSSRGEVYQQLTNQMAHELRTPLTAIMGHVDILNSCRIDEEALWRRSLGFVAGEAERLARLVEDLLSLSRLDRIPLNVQPMNLRAAAEEAISSLFAAAERNKVSLVLQAPPELLRVLADPDRMRQVFLNLLDNGIKYAPGGAVTVQLAPERESVRVEVADDGPGIPSPDLPRIFEPFYRGGQAASSVQGTGLGLTIVRALLDQHHAPITVNSAPSQGTTFAFSLPLARSEQRQT